MSEEIMHNLDTCEVTVVGDELDGEHESLELDVSQLQPHGLEMSSSNLGLVITGTDRRAVLLVGEMRHTVVNCQPHNVTLLSSVWRACLTLSGV